MKTNRGEEVLEINGAHYRLDEGNEEEGPCLSRVELKKWSDNYPPSWEDVDDTYVLCGKCKGDAFRVKPCNTNYETWAICLCGNKFVVHSG